MRRSERKSLVWYNTTYQLFMLYAHNSNLILVAITRTATATVQLLYCQLSNPGCWDTYSHCKWDCEQLCFICRPISGVEIFRLWFSNFHTEIQSLLHHPFALGKLFISIFWGDDNHPICPFTQRELPFNPFILFTIAIIILHNVRLITFCSFCHSHPIRQPGHSHPTISHPLCQPAASCVLVTFWVIIIIIFEANTHSYMENWNCSHAI